MIRYIIIYVRFIERQCTLPTWYGYHGTTCKARVSSSVCLTFMLRASGSLENIVTRFDEECQRFNLTSTFQMNSKMLKPPYKYLFIYIFAYHAYYIRTSSGFGISGFSPFMCMNQRIHSDSKAAQNHKPYLLVIRKHPKPWIVPQSYPQSLCQWWFCSIDFIGRKLYKHLMSISYTFKNFAHIDCMSYFWFPRNCAHTRRHDHAVGDP